MIDSIHVKEAIYNDSELIKLFNNNLFYLNTYTINSTVTQGIIYYLLKLFLHFVLFIFFFLFFIVIVTIIYF